MIEMKNEGSSKISEEGDDVIEGGDVEMKREPDVSVGTAKETGDVKGKKVKKRRSEDTESDQVVSKKVSLVS